MFGDADIGTSADDLEKFDIPGNVDVALVVGRTGKVQQQTGSLNFQGVGGSGQAAVGNQFQSFPSNDIDSARVSVRNGIGVDPHRAGTVNQLVWRSVTCRADEHRTPTGDEDISGQ